MESVYGRHRMLAQKDWWNTIIQKVKFLKTEEVFVFQGLKAKVWKPSAIVHEPSSAVNYWWVALRLRCKARKLQYTTQRQQHGLLRRKPFATLTAEYTWRHSHLLVQSNGSQRWFTCLHLVEFSCVFPVSFVSNRITGDTNCECLFHKYIGNWIYPFHPYVWNVHQDRPFFK